MILRPLHDWIGALIVLCGALLVASIAHAEPSEIVLQTIAMEAADQPFEGQVAVASVIINRARRAGKGLEWAVLRPKQFSCWNSPKWAFSWLSRHYGARTRSQALNALERARNAGNRHVTHYHTRSVMPYWAIGHKPELVIADHAFYSGID